MLQFPLKTDPLLQILPAKSEFHLQQSHVSNLAKRPRLAYGAHVTKTGLWLRFVLWSALGFHFVTRALQYLWESTK